MLKFLSKSFEKCISFFAWLSLIGMTIFSAIAGAIACQNNIVFGIITGAIIGFIAGLITTVLCFGFLAQILCIRKTLENIEKKLSEQQH